MYCSSRKFDVFVTYIQLLNVHSPKYIYIYIYIYIYMVCLPNFVKTYGGFKNTLHESSPPNIVGNIAYPKMPTTRRMAMMKRRTPRTQKTMSPTSSRIRQMFESICRPLIGNRAIVKGPRNESVREEGIEYGLLC